MGITKEVLWWMRKHKEADPALWKFGTQPIFLLLGHGRWQQLPGEWYLGDLGFRPDVERERGVPSKRLLDKALVLHFDGEHKPWLPRDVSAINMQSRVIPAWNSQLLRPYAPASMPSEWLAAPGGRCLLSRAPSPWLPPHVEDPPAAACDVGPLVPTSAIPGLRWLRLSGPSNNLFSDGVVRALPMVDSDVAGFLASSPLASAAENVLRPAFFDMLEPPFVELLLLEPRTVLDAYIQAAAADAAVTGGSLQYRHAHGGWRDACSVRQSAACDPRKGPGFPTGAEPVCWRITACANVKSRRWRMSGWTARNTNQFGGIWLRFAQRAVHSG
jgi:hypothetical protein